MNINKQHELELVALREELASANDKLEKIRGTCSHVNMAKDAFIPNSLDAWGRPVPQFLPYDFSGNPGASATQYCNGWNDAGGYWLNHINDIQQHLTAAEQRNAECAALLRRSTSAEGQDHKTWWNDRALILQADLKPTESGA